MENVCIDNYKAEAVGAKKLKYGLNYDEQAKLAAEEFAKKRKQRLLQVREQEKEYAKVNRQAYEERLAQQRKALYAELLQKWDRQHQQELLSLQNAHQRALDAASAAQKEAEETSEAVRHAEAASNARRALQAELAAKRFAEAAAQARLEREILARERMRRVVWLQQARNAEKTRDAEQVAKQQEAQRRAAEEARERLRRTGRNANIDFRFTRFHETGLEQQPPYNLPSGEPSLADSAELRARKAAKEAEFKRAAEERGRAALHRVRMERAAAQLTAQLEAELQARRAAASDASQPLPTAPSPLSRGMDAKQAAVEQDFARRQWLTWPHGAAAQLQHAPDWAVPRSTWPQPTPLPALRQSAPPLHTAQPAPINIQQNAVDQAAAPVAGKADKMTQCPDGVDRQTQTEPPEPEQQPVSWVPRPLQLCQHPASFSPGPLTAASALPATGGASSGSTASASLPACSLPHQAVPSEGIAPVPRSAHRGSARLEAGQHGATRVTPEGNAAQEGRLSEQAVAGEARPMEVPAGNMVRTLPGELSDSCCSSRSRSSARLADLAGAAGGAQPGRPHAPADGAAKVDAAPVKAPAAGQPSSASKSARKIEQTEGAHDQDRSRSATAELGQGNRAVQSEEHVTLPITADATCTVTITKGLGSAAHAGQTKLNSGPVERKATKDPAAEGMHTSQAAQRGLEMPQDTHLTGAFLAQAAAELEALCAETVSDQAAADLLDGAPGQHQQRQGRAQLPEKKRAMPKAGWQRGSLAQAKPAKTALQRAEELLASLTEDANTWGTSAGSAGGSKWQHLDLIGQSHGFADASLQFNRDDEHRLMAELEAILQESKRTLSSDTTSAPPSKAEGKEGTSSLEVLAERLQEAISETVCMTEDMLSHAHVEPSLSSETPSYSPDIVPPPSDAPAAANGAEEKAQRKGSSSSTCDMQAPDAGAGDGTAAKGELGIRGSVASSSCSSLLGALRLASIAEEASPNRDGGSDGDQGDIFSCSEDDGASDMSELPYDALSMGTTQIGSPLSGDQDNIYLSDIESLDSKDVQAACLD